MGTNPAVASEARAWGPDADAETVLGLQFFTGDADSAVERMLQGGLLVVPAAPALRDITRSVEYRQALLGADLIIPDSSYMVMVWNALCWVHPERRKIRRLSGLAYLRALLPRPQMSRSGSTLWVMSSEEAAARNREWLTRQGIVLDDRHVYIAPMYQQNGSSLEDAELLERLETTRPAHVIVTIGGGTQERLGLYLSRMLSYRPGIHCIGAAIAFLSGDQVRIPRWADKLYLGWLFRVLDDPKRFGPRYWAAKDLLPLMVRFGPRLPAMKQGQARP